MGSIRGSESDLMGRPHGEMGVSTFGGGWDAASLDEGGWSTSPPAIVSLLTGPGVFVGVWFAVAGRE